MNNILDGVKEHAIIPEADPQILEPIVSRAMMACSQHQYAEDAKEVFLQHMGMECSSVNAIEQSKLIMRGMLLFEVFTQRSARLIKEGLIKADGVSASPSEGLFKAIANVPLEVKGKPGSPKLKYDMARLINLARG